MSDDKANWFDGIPQWTPRQRRAAIAAAVAFVVLVEAVLLAWWFAPPALTMASVPAPSWSGRGFRSGALMRDFERHCSST